MGLRRWELGLKSIGGTLELAVDGGMGEERTVWGKELAQQGLAGMKGIGWEL